MTKSGFKNFVNIEKENQDKLMTNWPNSRFVFLTEDGLYFLFITLNRICIFVNGHDHLRMIVNIVDNDLNQAYKRLTSIHNSIGTKVSYVFDPKFGFIVNSPVEIGTGGFEFIMESKEGGKVYKGRSKFGQSIIDTITSVVKELS